MSSGRNRCPFCREPPIDGKEENIKRVLKRVEVNDPNALRQMGAIREEEGDYDSAFDYFAKASEFGNVEAHYHLGCMYYEGEGIEKDEEKGISHYEKAAIGGHTTARHNLAYHEGKNGNAERAVKHHIIAAKLGDEDSMKGLWKFYSLGYITKKDLDVTLRGHQAAIDATKSSQRDAAAKAKPMAKITKY
jgi:TPR repeat protein